MKDPQKAPPYLEDVPGLLAGLSDAEALELKREAADMALHVQRQRRAVEAEIPEEERWSFDVPRTAALLFDAMAREGLTSNVLALDVVPVANTLNLNAVGMLAALADLAARELATLTSEGMGARVTLHPESRCWF